MRARIGREKIGIGESDEQHRASMRTAGNGRSRLEFEFSGANAIFDEENLFGASAEDFEAALFLILRVPFGGRLAENIVLKDLDGDVAEGLIRNVSGDVGKCSWGEAGLAVLNLEGDRRLVFDGIDDLGVAESDVDVVVTVPMHESFDVRRHVDVEDANGFVLER